MDNRHGATQRDEETHAGGDKEQERTAQQASLVAGFEMGVDKRRRVEPKRLATLFRRESGLGANDMLGATDDRPERVVLVMLDILEAEEQDRGGHGDRQREHER